MPRQLTSLLLLLALLPALAAQSSHPVGWRDVGIRNTTSKGSRTLTCSETTGSPSTFRSRFIAAFRSRSCSELRERHCHCRNESDKWATRTLHVEHVFEDG